MAYRFKLDEPFEKGFRRIAREQIDRALSELSPFEVGPVGVHESRKALKRLRALVRLAAPAVGEKAAARRNAALRKVARLLAARRDEAVLLDTIRKVEASVDAEAKALLAPLHESLAARGPQLTGPLDAEMAQQARLLLVKEAKHLAKATFKARGFDALRPGLEVSYRAGRKGLKRAYLKPSNEAFHDLRKTVQWHWRQMALLSRAWPEEFEARIAASRELSQILGDDHDLAMLAHAARTAAGIPETAVAAVESACRVEQQMLRAAAEYRVERLFAEPPRAFCRRIESYWSAGRHIRPVAAPKAADQQPDASPAPTPNAAEPSPTTIIAAKTPGAAPSQRRA